MATALAPTQAALLCSSSSLRGDIQRKCVAKVSFNRALRLMSLPSQTDKFSERSAFYLPDSIKRRFSTVFAAAESDLDELTDVELEEMTPLEAFFDRFGSDFETLDAKKLRRIISAGFLSQENPYPSILIMLGSEAFVRQLCYEYPDGYVETYHFSLNVLSDIKEQHDDTRCFHIVTTDFSEISGSFDAIFLNYFPAFSKSFPKLLKEVTRFCKPGGTVVISLPCDKSRLVSLKEKSSGLLRSELPSKDSLEKMILSLPLELVSFEDLPNLYVASLKCSGLHEKRTKRNGNSSTLSNDSKYPLYINGDVIHGSGRGSKKLGYPTANLSVGSLPSKVARLQKGVYYGCAQIIDKSMDSSVHRMVMNIGNRPTFDENDVLTLEVHILHDFETDFYGKEMRIAILGFIREEMQFPSLDQLIDRIKKDIGVMQERLPDSDFNYQKGVPFFAQS